MATPTNVSHAQIVVSAVDKTGLLFNNLQRNLNSLTTQLSIVAGKFAIIKYAIEEVVGGFIAAARGIINLVEGYQQRVLTLSGMIMTKMKPGADIQQAWSNAFQFVLTQMPKLEEAAAKTALNLEEVLGIYTEIIRTGGEIPNLADTTQWESFLNILNAISLTIQGAPNRLVQAYQETRALMQGVADVHSTLARTIDAQMGGALKKNVEIWRQTGQLVTQLGQQLKGVGAVSGELSQLFTSKFEQLKTTTQQVLRPVFEPVYAGIVKYTEKLTNWIISHKQEIQDVANKWILVLDAIKDIAAELSKLVGGPLKIFFAAIDKVFHGLYAVLPPLIERFSKNVIEQQMWSPKFWPPEADVSGVPFPIPWPETQKEETLLDEIIKRYEDYARGFKETSKAAQGLKEETQGLLGLFDQTSRALGPAAEAAKKLIDKFAGIAKGAGLKGIQSQIAAIEQDYAEFIRDHGENLEVLKAKEQAINALRLADLKELLRLQEELEAQYSSKVSSMALETQKKILEYQREFGLISAEEKAKQLRVIHDQEIQQQIELKRKLLEATEDEKDRLRILNEIQQLQLQFARDEVHAYEIAKGRSDDLREQLALERARYEMSLRLLELQDRFAPDPENLKRRLALLDDYLSKLQAALPEVTKKESISIEQEINDALIERAQLLEEIKLKSDDLFYGLQVGFRELQAGSKVAAENIRDAVKNVGSSMINSFGQFFDYTNKGFGRLGDLAKNVLRDIYNELMRIMVVKPVVSSLTSAFGNVLRGIVGSGISIPSMSPTEMSAWGFEVHHAGGIVGLKKDEVPAILQRGEVVLSRQAVNVLSGASAPVIPAIDINVTNTSSVPIAKEDVSARYDPDMEKYIVNVILKDVHTGGKLRTAFGLR